MEVKMLKLIDKRQHLLQKMADLSLVVHGSYLERFSTCARRNCTCHQGKKHGPRAYVVVYRDARQRQVYVPQKQLPAVRRGLRQYEQLLELLRQVTRINLALMRAGALQESLAAARPGDLR
jgi:hypothetical protein